MVRTIYENTSVPVKWPKGPRSVRWIASRPYRSVGSTVDHTLGTRYATAPSSTTTRTD